MTIEGNSKINLALNVGERLPNGYHKVKMIMQEISLCDRVLLNFGGSSISLSCSKSSIPAGSDNIAYRAAEKFIDATKTGGVEIYIEKNIPSEAGLAGGSADAAAVLKGMNKFYGNPLSQDKLLEIGATLGADVPFCIMGGTALAEGVGEILTPLKSKVKTDVLIVKPPAGISTPWAYKRLDEVGFEPVDVDSSAAAIESGDIDALCKVMGNVFETVAKEATPEVFKIKKGLLELGAKGAMMSGSGTAVFGMFEDTQSLDKAFDYFKDRYEQTYKAKMI